MNMVLSLLLLGGGIVLIVSALLKPLVPRQEFPRFGALPRRSPRIMPVLLGVVIALGGIALLLLSRAEQP